MEPRLSKRYNTLVKAHMNTGHQLASGIKNLVDKDIAFNQTQAAWRFLNNDSCTLKELSNPLLEAAHELSEKECEEYALVAHDWSHLSYGKHLSKRDTYKTIKNSTGYLLQTSLMLSDRHGGPLSVVAMNLKDKTNIYSTYSDNTKRDLTNLEKLSDQIEWLNQQTFSKKLVHIIDREADAVGFLRSIENEFWLIRGKGTNKVQYNNEVKKVQDIVHELRFDEERTIEYKGKIAFQQIAETQITITRAAKPKKFNDDGKRIAVIKGKPITCRLIVSKIIDEKRNEIATWYLLSNLYEVKKATLALWYYWRWSIENYFKIMKSAGMQLESWKQSTSLAIARRILVASMACVWIWQIANAKEPKAEELRKLLVRLSGRQMSWKKKFTYPAMLAGLWTLLAIEDTLKVYDLKEIRSLLSSVLGERGLV